MAVQRWDLDDVEDSGQPSMNPWPDGEYVKYADYQALEAACRSAIKTVAVPGDQHAIGCPEHPSYIVVNTKACALFQDAINAPWWKRWWWRIRYAFDE